MFFELYTRDATTSLLLGLFAILIVFIIFRIRDDMKLPPGPYGLPIVGYLPFLTKNPHLKLTELKKKYGPIFSMRLGGQLVVVICDFASIKETFSRYDVYGRPPYPTFASRETIELGAIHSMGWKDQRRFLLHSLRDLGFGKSKMEIDIQTEIEELMSLFQRHNEDPVSPREYLRFSTYNVLSSLFFGKKQKIDDRKNLFFKDLFHSNRLTVKIAVMCSFFPMVAKFINTAIVVTKTIKLEPEFVKFVRKEIEEHQKTMNPSNIRDFIDAFLVEAERTKDDPKTTFTTPVLQDVVEIFVSGGGEGLLRSIEWLILISAAYPEVQRRIQSEIDSEIGDRFPSRSDYVKMPYTEAVICEKNRWRSLTINLPRYTFEDVRINSYVIPKHTQVWALFWTLDNDTEVWGEETEKFKPERFLSEDGKRVKKPESFIPFSIGKRICPGETIANIGVFMYFVAILQRFNIRFPDGFVPDMEANIIIAAVAKPFKVLFELRNP